VAMLYARYGNLQTLGHILSGIAAAAAGLLIAMTAKMPTPLFKRGEYVAPIIAALVFVAVGPLQLPLQWVLIVLAPLSVAIAWVRR
jgi:chromate transporter